MGQLTRQEGHGDPTFLVIFKNTADLIDELGRLISSTLRLLQLVQITTLVWLEVQEVQHGVYCLVGENNGGIDSTDYQIMIVEAGTGTSSDSNRFDMHY